MYANIKQAKFKGITNYYLWLNPAKMDNYATISKDIIVNHLNAVIPNYEFQIILNYTDVDDPKKFNGGDMVEREAHAIGRHGAEQARRLQRPEDALRHLDDEIADVVVVFFQDARQRRQCARRAPGRRAEIAGDEEFARLAAEMAGDGERTCEHERIE